ncbi:MAG: hypothetical protein JKY65_13745, partial [Planctomycetes bacterium]|nr:hypothetical protein [Planctomycetota bacterium]
PALLARLAASKIGAAGEGQPIPVELTFAGTVRGLAFEAPDGVSALRTKTGCLVYAERPGPLVVVVVVVDKELRTSRHKLSLVAR